ncbi:unnamed protein product [Moneuplotes crassus]|uniref:hydroxyacylglutathione hydrolase n=1 Tax=Euplotes crassus TaxID=5936 RepID=A0AAD1XGX8_EUPCR|nr:unnamed protein product [Moneuplotes crassus]
MLNFGSRFGLTGTRVALKHAKIGSNFYKAATANSLTSRALSTNEKYNFIKKVEKSSLSHGQYDLEGGHSLTQYLSLYKFYNDNIGYVLLDPKTNSLILIDAGHYKTSRDVIEELEETHEAKLRYIFTTHGHWDHVNGNEEWKENRPELEIITGNYPDVDIPAATQRMNDLDTMTIGDLTFACLNVPGHTIEHVAFVVTHVTETSTKIPFLFSGKFTFHIIGDTLFVGGCGRIFTGTAEQLFYSLQKLINLPHDTLLFCGHEYTKANLKFAKYVDPDNSAIDMKMDQVDEVLSKGQFTVGSRLGEELMYNPFYKCVSTTEENPFLDPVLQTQDPVKRFEKIRALKDNF